jgi:hypothetical protein
VPTTRPYNPEEWGSRYGGKSGPGPHAEAAQYPSELPRPAPPATSVTHPPPSIDPYLERWREVSAKIAEQLGQGGYDPTTAGRYYEESRLPIEGQMHQQAGQLSEYLARQGMGTSGLNVGGHAQLSSNAASLESQAKLKSIDMATEVRRRELLDEFSAEAMKLQPELTKYGIDVQKFVSEMQARLQKEIADRQINAQEQAGWGNLFGMLGGGALAGIMMSDERLKEDIQEISSDGDVVFEYTKKAQKMFNVPSGPQIGVVAQDIEDEYPDCVSKDPVTGYKRVNYGRLAIRRAEK